MKQLLLICALIGQAVLAAEKSRVMAKQVEDQKLQKTQCFAQSWERFVESLRH